MPIKKVLEGGKVPVKIWTEDVEPEAEAQLLNTARLPFVFKHVAAMPDVHMGRGATIGSVVATKGAVCPAAVGVDIGCGMIAAKLRGLNREDLGDLAALRHSIERSVPVGPDGNNRIADTVDKWGGWAKWDGLSQRHDMQKARAQLGSLGGGNHFIEVCLDAEGGVWVVLHSGSRGIGNKLAQGHIEDAQADMKRLFIDLPDPELAYFAMNTPECDLYLGDLRWAQAYALENREEMLRRVLKDVAHHVKDKPFFVDHKVNCHHNFAEVENHFGENVLVTRKGAIRARVGDLGVIPGSMGAKSYVVRGLGNKESFESCSHGAGRRMSRTKARATFTEEDLKRQTEGVECRKDRAILDEAPGAYKPIDEVMANSTDLVEVVAELKQVLCVKGETGERRRRGNRDKKREAATA